MEKKWLEPLMETEGDNEISDGNELQRIYAATRNE